jgi:leader peptidase (prepilin peptidase) / N-methyltransferase
LVKYRDVLPGASVAVAAIALAGAGAAQVFLLDPVDAAFGTSLAAVALFVAAVDLARFEIPDIASFAIFALGLAWSQTWGLDAGAAVDALLRSLVVIGSFFAIRAGYRALRNLEGLGLGDVKLAGAGAAWLSWPHIAAALLIAVGAAIAVIVGRSIVTRQQIKAHAAIPFGSFLAPAIWITWFAQVVGL